jgi:hypothetical protein
LNQDDDIHLIVTVKGFILPRFYDMKIFHRPNRRMQIQNHHADNGPSTEHDRMHGCHCMSFPTAPPSAKHYLRTHFGLACAMASLQSGSLVHNDNTGIVAPFLPLLLLALHAPTRLDTSKGMYLG